MGKKKKKKVKKKKKIKKKVIKKIKKKKAVKKRSLKKKAAKKKVIKKKTVRAKKSAIGVSLEEVGAITHYFPHVEVAVVKVTKGALNLGDSILIKGHTTKLKEKVNSMQLDHMPIKVATRGQEIGLRVKKKVREHDTVYKVVG